MTPLGPDFASADSNSVQNCAMTGPDTSMYWAARVRRVVAAVGTSLAIE